MNSTESDAYNANLKNKGGFGANEKDEGKIRRGDLFYVFRARDPRVVV